MIINVSPVGLLPIYHRRPTILLARVQQEYSRGLLRCKQDNNLIEQHIYGS